MSWRNIRLIFRREVGDQLRDRRTLFMVVVLPLVLYPALGIGMLQMSLLFSEQPRTVVMLGVDDLPAPPLLNAAKDRIADEWFTNPGDSATLQIVTDHAAASPPASEKNAPSAMETPQDEEQGEAVETASREALHLPPPPEEAAPEMGEDLSEQQLQLQVAQEIRTRLQRITELKKEIQQIASTSEAKPEQETSEEKAKSEQVNQLLTEVAQLFSAGNIQVLILIPEGFAESITRENERLMNRTEATPTEERLRPTILRNSANEKSLIAYGRVREALDAWEQAILNERLQMANLPADLTSPLNVDRVDLAKGEELAANVWSKLFPAMLVVMAMTGAFHPAVDLGAGEKERGTMETLLISPALRSEIVIGKFLTVLLFSLVTALLNLTSMGMTGLHMLNSAGGGQLEGIGDFTIPPLNQLMWVGIMALPLASLFSSLSLAFALFAKSSKEGQYYLTPLLTVTMGLTVFCLSPAVEITPFYSLVPVMGPALLLKGMLLGGGSTSELLWYVGPVLTTSFLYSGLGLWWAMDLFRSEDVLFRESERFDLKLWLRHLLRDKEATPSFSEAVFCFVLIMMLQFVMLKAFGAALNSAAPGQQATTMVQLLVVQQLVIIACPALFMGILLTKSPLRTFQFRLPHWKYWALGLLLPLVLHPLALELQLRLSWFFPALKKDTLEALAAMSDGSLSIGLVLFAFAFTPAICEELAFRGFIMSGFRQRGRDGLAIVFSALLFGMMHMIPQQVFNASLLGLVLGLLAVKSGSIYPAMLFHFVNNSLGVLHGHLAKLRETCGVTRALTVQSGAEVHYPLWLVLIALLVAVPLIVFLFRLRTPKMSET